MREIVNYLIEANLGLLFFILFYKLLLARETSFRFQRFFMLSGVMISVLAPLIHLDGTPFFPPVQGHASSVQLLPEIVAESIAAETGVESVLYSPWQIAGIIYVIVALFLVVALVRRMEKLMVKMRDEKHYRQGRYKIIESAENKPAFSFFNLIYIGNAPELTPLEKQRIIAHESVHAAQLHSLDNLLLQVIGILFWFNPCIHSYKKIFVQLHEFEADARTATGDEVNAYCSLLAKVALRSAEFPFANHFNQSLTLKRIEMMRTIKKRTNFWKFVAAAVVITCCFVFIACQDQVNGSNPLSVPTAVQSHATPEGGMDALYKYLKMNLRYPREAREKRIQGKVLVEFVVKADGSVSDIQVLSSPDAALSEEAKRLMASGPKWIPAKNSVEVIEQVLVLPIVFRLNGAINTTPETATPDGALKEVVAVGYAPESK